MPTSARWYALQWFSDHEKGGPDAVLTRKAPSTRMRRLMVRNGQVERRPIGQFNFQAWVLTPEGREMLLKKPKARRPRHPPQEANP